MKVMNMNRSELSLYLMHFCLWWVTFYESFRECIFLENSNFYVCQPGNFLWERPFTSTVVYQKFDIFGEPISDMHTFWKFVCLVFPIPLYPFLFLLSLQFL